MPGAGLGVLWCAVHAETRARQKVLPKLPFPVACMALVDYKVVMSCHLPCAACAGFACLGSGQPHILEAGQSGVGQTPHELSRTLLRPDMSTTL